MLDISMAAHTETGVRDENEDSLRLGNEGWLRYAVLADGAGGHARGAEASRRVVDRVAQHLSDATFAAALLNDALLDAHADLQQAQVGAQGASRMHSTVVALWLDTRHDQALFSHIGDSRLYRLRYGRAELLTADDSVVQRMLEGGAINAQQALDHPMKNLLLAAAGMKEPVEPHTIAAPEPLEDGDAYLLCTDGWWGPLCSADMVDTLAAAVSPEHWLVLMSELIEARATASQDNYSAIAVWVSDPAESTQSMGEYI